MNLKECEVRVAEIEEQIKALNSELEAYQLYFAIINQIKKAGHKGCTIRDLVRYSKSVAKFEIDEIETAIKDLIEQGEIEQKVFSTPSGRGRKRTAYMLGEKHG